MVSHKAQTYSYKSWWYIILKNRCHSKIIQFSSYYLNQNYALNFSCSSLISWVDGGGYLIYLVKEKLKASHKMWIAVNNIQNDDPEHCIWSHAGRR